MTRVAQSIRAIAFGAVLAAGALAFAPAGMAAENEPSQTTATFGNWTVRCMPMTDSADRACEMLQTISIEDGGTIANLAVGRIPGDDVLRMVVQLPLGVSLSEAVDIEVPGADHTKAAFETCFPNLCVAQATLSEDVLEAFKSGDTLTIAFKDRAKKSIAVKASLAGFSAAYGSMEDVE